MREVGSGRCGRRPARRHRRRAARGLPGKRHQPRHRHRQPRGAEGEAQRPFGRRPAGHREARRGAPGAPQGCRCRHARRGCPHRRRRRAHGPRDRCGGFQVSVWRRRAPELELVLAQRALRGRAEHRRLPRDPEPARGAAHRRDPGGRRRLSPAPRGVCRPARRRDRTPGGRGRAGRDRAGLHPRQDARAAQARARRQRRRLAIHRVVREEDEGSRG